MLRSKVYFVCIVAVVLGSPGYGLAAGASPSADGQALELHQAVAIAQERDEASRALEARSDGLRERAVADGALPDPELMLGAEGVPVRSPGSSDMMTMYKLGLRQRFPAGQTRALTRGRTETLAQVESAEHAARQRLVAHRTRAAWLEWAAARESLERARATERAFAELVETTESRYRAGRGRQMDISQARLERARLQQRILTRESALDQTRAELARWIGNAMGPEIIPGSLPDWNDPGRRSMLTQRLADHPRIRADRARSEVGQADTRLARQAYRPEWMVEAGYAHQPGRDPMSGAGMSDKLFAMVSFNLPLFAGNRQDRVLASTRAELTALEHQRGERLHEYTGRLNQALARWDRGGEILELFDQILLPEALRSEEAAFSAYQAGQASFDELVRARIEVLDQRLDRIEARLDRLDARSELFYLAGQQSGDRTGDQP